MQAVETKDLQRSFIKKNITKTALRNINLNIEKGSFYGLLGPNGAGKTTLIKILSTLLLPSKGTAKVLGYDVRTHTNDIRWRMSLVSGGEFSGYGLLTVEEQLWMFALFNGMNSNDARNKIDELLNIVGLSEARKIELAELSTGMRQKMNLVRGLMTDPEILFLDEPTLGLDIEVARDVREYLKKWINEGNKARTVLLTTHYMQEADELCERIGIINDGKLIMEGSSADIKKKAAYDSKYIIRSNNEYKLDLVSPSLKAINVSTNKYIIYLYDNKIEREVYEHLQFNKDILTFEKFLPTLEDAFISLTGSTLN